MTRQLYNIFINIYSLGTLMISTLKSDKIKDDKFSPWRGNVLTSPQSNTADLRFKISLGEWDFYFASCICVYIFIYKCIHLEIQKYKLIHPHDAFLTQVISLMTTCYWITNLRTQSWRKIASHALRILQLL